MSNTEIEKQALQQKFGIKRGDIYYKYLDCGQVNWGMKRFVVSDIGDGCCCRTPFYVELDYLNNDHEKETIHVNSECLVEYSLDERSAWSHRKNQVTKHIIHYEKILQRLKNEEQDILAHLYGALETSSSHGIGG